jgi:hypothetical protein
MRDRRPRSGGTAAMLLLWRSRRVRLLQRPMAGGRDVSLFSDASLWEGRPGRGGGQRGGGAGLGMEGATAMQEGMWEEGVAKIWVCVQSDTL